jgi:hypothetical protein
VGTKPVVVPSTALPRSNSSCACGAPWPNFVILRFDQYGAAGSRRLGGHHASGGGRQNRAPVPSVAKRLLQVQPGVEVGSLDLLRVSEGDVEAHRDVEEEQAQRGLSGGMPGRRSSQLPGQVDSSDGAGSVTQGDAGVEIGLEGERREGDENVIAGPAVDIEPGRFCVEFDLRAPLYCVRGDRHVCLGGNSGIVSVADGDRDPLERREVRRRLEIRIEAADREREVGLVTPGKAHCHVAGDREAGEMRVVK